MVELDYQDTIDDLGGTTFLAYALAAVGALNWLFVDASAGGLLGSYLGSGTAPTIYLVIGVAGAVMLVSLFTDVEIGDMTSDDGGGGGDE